MHILWISVHIQDLSSLLDHKLPQRWDLVLFIWIMFRTGSPGNFPATREHVKMKNTRCFPGACGIIVLQTESVASPNSPFKAQVECHLVLKVLPDISLGSRLFLDCLSRILVLFTKYFQSSFWTHGQIVFPWPLWSSKWSRDLLWPPNKSRNYLCYFWVETFRASERVILSSSSCLSNWEAQRYSFPLAGVLKWGHHPAEYLFPWFEI